MTLKSIVKRALFFALAIVFGQRMVSAVTVLSPGQLPPSGSTVSLKVDGQNKFLSYTSPESASSDGARRTLALVEGTSGDQFIFNQIRDTNTFMLISLDNHTVQGYVSVVGDSKVPDLNVSILTMDSSGKISSKVNVADTNIFYTGVGDNATLVASGRYPNWSNTVPAYWTNVEGPLRNCKGGLTGFSPAQEGDATPFSFVVVSTPTVPPAFTPRSDAQVSFSPTVPPYNVYTFNDAWKSTDTVVSAKFSIAAKNNAIFMVSSTKGGTTGTNVRAITIGAFANDSFIFRTGDFDTGKDTRVYPSAGSTILTDENTYVPFWITYNKSTGAWQIGKGTDIGSNVQASWTDPNPLNVPTIYLGLGGWIDPQGAQVFYKDVTMGTSTPTTAQIISTGQTVFNDAWQTTAPGTMSAVFTVAATTGVTINFTPASSIPTSGSFYTMILGYNDNQTITLVHQGVAMPTKVVPGLLTGSAQTFWASCSNGTLSVGSGNMVGQNVLFSWIDPSPLTDGVYISFSGPVGTQFSNIAVTSSVSVQPQTKTLTVAAFPSGVVEGSLVAIKCVDPSCVSNGFYAMVGGETDTATSSVLTTASPDSSKANAQFIIKNINTVSGTFQLVSQSTGWTIKSIVSNIVAAKDVTASNPGATFYYEKDSDGKTYISSVYDLLDARSIAFLNAATGDSFPSNLWPLNNKAYLTVLWDWHSFRNIANKGTDANGRVIWSPATSNEAKNFMIEAVAVTAPTQTTTTQPTITLSAATDLPDEGSIVAIKCIEKNGYLNSAETEIKTNGTKDMSTAQFTIKNVNKAAGTFQLIPSQGGYVQAGVSIIRMNQNANVKDTIGATLYCEKDSSGNKYISTFFDPSDPLNTGFLSATTGDTYAGWTPGTRAYWNSPWDWPSLRNIVNKGTISVVWNPATPLDASHFAIEVVKTPAQVTADTLASEKAVADKLAADKLAADAAAKATADKAAADKAAADAAAKAAADKAAADKLVADAAAKAAADKAAADAAAKVAADKLAAGDKTVSVNAVDKPLARKQQVTSSEFDTTIQSAAALKGLGSGRAVSTATGRTTSQKTGVASQSRGAVKTVGKVTTKKATSRR